MIDLKKYSSDNYERGASRMKECAWWVTRSLLFAPWFPVPSLLKVIALRIFGANVGIQVVIRGRVNITMPWRLWIGDYVWIGDEVMILSLNDVRIGSNTCISQRSFLCTGSHDFSKESFGLVTAPIEIGNSCWIGASSFISPGVIMNQGSRCLAGAVVVKSVASGATVGGVPAREL